MELPWLLASSIIVLITRNSNALSSPSFVVSFQNSGGWSTEEWIEFDKPIPILKEFTACHWERIRFFTSDMITVWSYCIARNDQQNDINCTQLHSSEM